MSTSSVVSLIQSQVTDLGTAVLTILTAVIGLGLAYLVFKFGWRKVKGSVR